MPPALAVKLVSGWLCCLYDDLGRCFNIGTVVSWVSWVSRASSWHTLAVGHQGVVLWYKPTEEAESHNSALWHGPRGFRCSVGSACRRLRSSVGQSVRLLTVWSRVRAPPGTSNDGIPFFCRMAVGHAPVHKNGQRILWCTTPLSEGGFEPHAPKHL